MIRINPAVFALAESGNIGDLKQALQHAVELEHSTMPPYLFAMYSLRGTSPANNEIAGILRKVAVEEMLHMLLAGNILKAIGGKPVINTPGFVPAYPSRLPGSVGSLVVPLQSFSRELVRDVFMEIEEPEKPLDFEVKLLVQDENPPKTIGEFYQRIRKVFEDEGDSIIVDKTGETQPEDKDDFTVNMRITSAQQAIDAINIIIEQGEGTSSSPFFPGGATEPANDKLAHYYRFAELVRGRIKKNPEATPASPPDKLYIYDSTDPIFFDADLVLPFPDNPKSAMYPEGSEARAASDQVNKIYTKILKFLHQAFNTNPGRLDDAIELMRTELMHAVDKLIKIGLDDGKRAAPTFEYLP